MKTSSQDVLITKNGLYTNDNQQENDVNGVMAGTADSNIKNINDPNYLSPFEKSQLEIQMDNFAAIYKTDKDIAKAEGIDFTSYEAAYQAYLSYMIPLIADMTTYSPIVRSTFNSMVTAVQVEQKRFSAATQAQYNQQMNQARTDIDDGQTKYKALQSEAETMKSSVAGISDAADRAISSAGFASNAASTASQAANEASQAASSALASAMSAQTNASSAVAQASSAAADSKDAKQIAGAVSQSYKTLTDGSTMTIAELEGGLAAKLTKSDLNGYATQDWSNNQIKTTADGINDTLSSVKSTVDGHTTSINTLQTDSNGFKDQFTKVNDTLGKHTTDIGTLQTDSNGFKAQFQTVNDNIGKYTTDINGKLTTLQGSFDLSSQQLSTTMSKVDSMSIGGVNLLPNSDFESSITTGIGTVNSGSYSFSKDYHYHGVQSLKISIASNISSADSGTILKIPNPQTSTEYTTTGWLYSEVARTIVISNYSNNWISLGRTNVQVPEKKWTKFVVHFKTTTITNNAGTAIFVNGVTGDDIQPFYLDCVQIEKGNVATDWSPAPEDNATVTALTQVKQTADGAQVLATDNQGDIASLQVTAKGLQSTVKSKVSSDQLTQLSGQLTNEIKGLSSSTSSKFKQTADDINGLVKKGDVVNQFNIDAGGALLSTSGNSTKIVFSSPNIIFDSVNPVQIPNANIPGTLTGKTFEAGTITATTKINGADIEAPIIHSPSGSFKLDGKTGDIIGASIHSADNSWGISKDGVINGATINASVLNLGDNGQLTGSYSVNDDTSYFQPIRGTGSLHIEHGYIQSTANVSYYNKILNGISGDKWGHWASSTQFIPATDQANPGTGNVAESTLTPAFLKLDIFNADKSLVKSRAYIDGTGLYINDGQTQSIVSMLSDYELISNGMAYLNSGIEMKKHATFTFGNLVLNGYHTIAMLDGKAINFTSATSHGSPIEVRAKTFTKLSRLSIKHDITPLSTAESSRLLNAIDVEKFRYTHDGATYKYQYGGVIDDVNSLGSKRYSMPSELLSEDGTGINLDSLTGILIKTVQEQERKIGKLSMRLTRLEMEK